MRVLHKRCFSCKFIMTLPLRIHHIFYCLTDQSSLLLSCKKFELTAGIAVNAVAIVEEEQFQTSMAMLRVANKRQADTTKKLTALLQKHQKLDDDLNELSLYGPHLKRALTGSLPKSFVDDKAEVLTSTKPGRSSSSSSRSLAETARCNLRQITCRGCRADWRFQ